MLKRNAQTNETNTINIVSRVAIAVGLGTVLLCAGCREVDDDPPIVGAWVSEEVTCGDEDWIDLDSDLEGEGRIYFWLDGDCYYADYDVELEDIRGDRYELSFKYEDRAYASAFDFDMECEVDRHGDLECEGSDSFNSFEWNFERD